MTAGVVPAVEPAEARPGRRAWIGLVVLLAGTFVVQVDFFIVNVSLPSIQRDLSASLSQIQLIAVSYGGAYAIAVVTGGRLGDLFGRRRLFLAGLLGFAAASLVAGVAWSAWTLVAARVAQGVAAATVMPQALGSLHAMFTGRARERAFSIFGVSMGLAWVSGIILGGLLLGANIAHLGWRAIFLINLPLAALVLVGTLLTVTESRRPAAQGLDLAGMASFAAVVALLVVPLIQGRQAGWPAWSYACLALAPAATGLLVVVERRVLATGRSPVLSPDLFRDRTFRLGLTVIVVFFLGPPGFFLLTTLYLQSVLGFAAVPAGLSLLPFGIAFVAVSSSVKRLKQRLGDGVIVLGVGVMAAGLVGFAATIELTKAHLTVVALIPATAVIGVGQALVTTPLYEMLLRNVRKEIASTASAVFTTIQLVAQSLSVAVVVIVFGVVTQHQVSSRLPVEAARLRTTLAATDAPAGDIEAAVAALRACGRSAVGDLATGTRVGCDPQPAYQDEVEAAVRRTVADSARDGFARTLLFNLAVLLTSGLIMGLSIRRSRRR
jgi:EmrB/QacA subfamily drug resistance transporter